jgi:hypothetical protein
MADICDRDRRNSRIGERYSDAWQPKPTNLYGNYHLDPDLWYRACSLDTCQLHCFGALSQ